MIDYNLNPTAVMLPFQLQARARTREAAARFEPLRPLLVELIGQRKTLRQIAIELQKRGVLAPMGGAVWMPSSVSRAVRLLGLKARGRWG